MAKKVHSPFESPEGCLLRWLEEHQTKTRLGPIAKFTQKELADEYGVSVSTANTLIQLLVKTRCVEVIRGGRYRVTQIGNQVIKKMDEIEKTIGGNYRAD